MHFFTDPTLLNTQAAANSFGPMNGSESTKYNISSKHTVSALAKIFACQDAMMLVMPHVDDMGNPSTSLVNIVLKPIEGLDIRLSPVKYYIYRGVDKASFITGTGINPAGTTGNTEFIEKFWTNWTNYKTNTNQPTLPDPTPQSFGYDSTLTDATKKILLLEEFYNSEESTNTFINDFQAIKVTEGEWIANLQTSINFEFEIILDTDHITMNLEYAQQYKQIIEVTGLSGFELKMAREKVLNYIDPAAFFGMHYSIGAYLASYSGATKNPPVLRRETDLVNDIVNQFHNKTVAYLDVRSEHGYSYFVYENYRNDQPPGGTPTSSPTMNVKSASATDFDFLDHLVVEWPLINLTSPPASLSPLVDGDKIDFQLRLNDNSKPLLFAENPKLFGEKNIDNFIKETDLLPANPTPPLEWSETFTVEIPHEVNGNVKSNVAHHIKLQYFRQEDNAGSPNTVLKAANFLDGTFGGINIPSLNVPTPFQHIANNKRKLVNRGNFTFVAENGVFQDDTRLLFYADNVFSLKNSGNNFPTFNPTISASNPEEIFSNKNVILSKSEIREGTDDIDVLSIVGYNRTSLETTPEENLIMLGLMKSELTALNGLNGVSDLHQKYFVFQEILGPGDAPLTDALLGTTYRKFRIDVQGLDSNGEKKVIDSSSLSPKVEVYGFNFNMLCSKAFGVAAIIPDAIPDAGVFTEEFIDTYRFDYDGNSPIVTALFPNGIVKVDDIQNTNNTTDPEIGLIGEMFYPVDTKGGTVLSTKRNTYPLIVLSHANGGRYTDYRGLATHLANNGFIVSVLSSLDGSLPLDEYKLYTRAAFASFCTFSTAYPTTYYIAMLSPQLFLVYYNDMSTPINSNYAFEKVTAIKGTFDTSVTPQNFVISSESLLPWTKGIDFEIDTTGSTPTKIKFKFETTILLTSTDISSEVTFTEGSPASVIPFTADYHIAIISRTNSLDTIYVYYNNPTAAPISSDYEYEKLTVLKGTWNTAGGPPNEFNVSSAYLLSWAKGSDFDILEAGATPFALQFKIRIGFHGLGTLGRTNLIYPHLQIIKSKFGNRVEQEFGLIGHSRGGETVVRFAREIAAPPPADIPGFDISSPGSRTAPEWKNVPNTLRTVKAIISLAPTDQWDTQENLTQDIPYFVLYGSMDGDVAGYRQTTSPNRTGGFSLIDRAVNDTEKAMAFVHGATHNGFITNNHDFNVNVYKSFASNIIRSEIQKNITKAYMNAFFRIFLKNENIWRPMFYGDVIPLSTQYNDIFLQYNRMTSGEHMKIHDFETMGNLGTGVGKVSLNGGVTGLREGNLIDEDIQTPHDTKGLIVSWKKADELKFNISASGEDVSNFDYLSFRIAHVAQINPKSPKTSFKFTDTPYIFSSPGMPDRYNSPPSPPFMNYDDAIDGMYSSLKKLEIRIGDTIGISFSKTMDRQIPSPHFREVRYNEGVTFDTLDDKGTSTDFTDDDIEFTYQNFTKSAMMTIRIPLSSFDTNGVDLTKIREVALIFPMGSGEIVIDDVEFTN